jgi:hypothetical protein
LLHTSSNRSPRQEYSDEERAYILQVATEHGVLGENNRYVGLCDVLGFRNMVSRIGKGGLKELASTYTELIGRVKDITSETHTETWYVGQQQYE